MKSYLPLLILALLISSIAKTQSNPPANTQDSLALIDLYKSTNGPGWTDHTNWMTSSPMYTWHGVSMRNGRVLFLILENNHLVGSLPSSIGDLTALNVLYLDGNGLTGGIPSSLGTITGLNSINLQLNQLTGSVPASFANLTGLSLFLLGHNQLSGIIPTFSASFAALPDLSYNQFNFSSYEAGYSAAHPTRGGDSPQVKLPLLINGNKLSVAAGGDVSLNTYNWYKDGAVVATITGDSTVTISSAGNYSVAVTSTAVPHLTLYSIQPVNSTDSLALVDLYNATAGSSWTNSTNWLTPTPVDLWYGVSTQNGQVTRLNLPYNNLNGPLPSSISNITQLNDLELNNNQLSGTIPASLSNLSQLSTLNLGFNLFGASIPPELGNAPHLTNLYLNNNQLTDTIPLSLTHDTQLNNLDLASNQLTGSIPPFVNLPFLDNVDLRNNQFTGPLPILKNVPVLTLLAVSNNQLTDSIPAMYGNLHMGALWADHNELSGSIPNALFNNKGLMSVDLSYNQLTGTIPDSAFTSQGPTSLELQFNQLSGPLPASFSRLSRFLSWDISNNRFTFAGLDSLPSSIYSSGWYTPQANIPLVQKGDTLYVAAGGRPAQETFNLYKDGALLATQTGDSMFVITSVGRYNILTTDATATALTLRSDSIGATLILPATNTTATQTIGSGAADITSGIFQLATLTPSSGANALSGNVTATVTIDNSVSTFGGKPYVQRHYDITPADNASTAQATVTVYFTQQEFDAYNVYVTSNNLNLPLLPTNGIDNGNVQIVQYHGEFTGTSAPGNYSQGSQLIIPAVSWDATDGWWAVSFPVTGFSGFFLSSGSNPLPLTLLSFAGQLKGGEVALTWQTTDEVNTRRFIVERAEVAGFTAIGTVASRDLPGKNDYDFADVAPLPGINAYRLKMEDIDHRYSYSPVVPVTADATATACLIFPNPAGDRTTVLFSLRSGARYAVQLSDQTGKILNLISGSAIEGINKVGIDLNGLAKGIYIITIIDSQYGRRSLSCEHF